MFKGCWWQHPDDVRQELSLRGLPIEELEGKNSLTIVDLTHQYNRSGKTDRFKYGQMRQEKLLNWATKPCGVQVLLTCCHAGDIFQTWSTLKVHWMMSLENFRL